MAHAYQHSLFSEMNNELTTDMVDFVKFYKRWWLVPNITKAVVICFHLNNKLASMELHVMFDEARLEDDFAPVYLVQLSSTDR